MAASTPPLDDLDHHLLELLQRDAGRTLRDLGEDVGLSPSAVQRRVKRLESRGVIARKVVELAPEFTADVVLAVCLVTLERESSQNHAAFQRRLLAAPEVQQVYTVSGDWDYVVMFATRGMRHHNEATTRLLSDAPNVKRYTTLFVLEPVRASNAIPTRDVG
jgi:Lrp/AsnC family transcriptional regulator, leucine-responsive regulatory protein